jgi:EF hand domain-containing protein
MCGRFTLRHRKAAVLAFSYRATDRTIAAWRSPAKGDQEGFNMRGHAFVVGLASAALAFTAVAGTGHAQQGPGQAQQGTEQSQPDRGMMGGGMMEGGGRMGRGMMGRGMDHDMMRGMMGQERQGPQRGDMMMRMMFSLMDADGDGSISLLEFQAAHERIFKGMDQNKDGRLTMEEMRSFMRGGGP